MRPYFLSAPAVAGSTLALKDRSKGTTTSWRQGLPWLKRAGFVPVDLVDSWLAPAKMSHQDQAALPECFGDEGLRLVGLSLIRRSIIDPDHAPDNTAYADSSIDAARSLGAPVVSIGFHRPLTDQQMGPFPFWAVPRPSDGADRGTGGEAVRKLRELCDHAKNVGVARSLELYEGTLVGSGGDAASMVEEAGEDKTLGSTRTLRTFGANRHRSTATWRETLARCLPYMNYWRVKNFRRAPTWPAGPIVTLLCAPSDGDIDYHEAFRMAAAARYCRAICIERYGGDWPWAQKTPLEYVKWLLEEMGCSELPLPPPREKARQGAV